MKLVPHISQETSLYNIFSQLDFDIGTNEFVSVPTASYAVSLLSREYGIPMNTSVDNYLA
jgi:hypothetical protein